MSTLIPWKLLSVAAIAILITPCVPAGESFHGEVAVEPSATSRGAADTPDEGSRARPLQRPEAEKAPPPDTMGHADSQDEWDPASRKLAQVPAGVRATDRA
ncbi:MAG TPA: hypothetical protein VMT16_11860 [Thermoanaerobaculia bacterium]|nr:hypothetical protein [Thermoanaerobaculia bacterium]